MKAYTMKPAVNVTRMSSRGQVVIPEVIRNLMKLGKGTVFVVRGIGTTITLEVIR